MTPDNEIRSAAAMLRLACACVLIVCTPSTLLAQAAAATSATAAVAPTPTPTAQNSKQKLQAADAYLDGAKALDRSDYPGAERHFSRALELSPDNRDYETAFAIAREHHVTSLVQQSGRETMIGHTAQAASYLAEARLLDPQNPLVTQHGDLKVRADEPWLVKEPTFAGAIKLTPTPGLKSFHFHTEVQQIVRDVTTAYGIRTIFDDSVTHQNIRFDLDDVSYEQAMHILLRMNHLFAVSMDGKTILVARDTPDNRQRLERQMEETVYVSGLTIEQMNDLGNVVRNIFEVKQATVQNTLGNLVIRAPEQTINALNLTLADLLDGSSEVLLDMKLYSVDTTHMRLTGLSLPQQIGTYNVASQAQSLVTANQTIVNQAIAQGLIPSGSSVLQIAEYLIASGAATSTLLSSTLGIFGGGLTTTGIYATGGATLSFGLNSSDIRSLDEIQLRITDRQPGDFRVGSRYPITTATYSTGVAATSSSLAGVSINGVSASSLLSQLTGSSSQTIPQIQYEDLGLTLKATPTITKNNAVNLKLDFKIEALAGGALDGIPILNNRQFVSDVTVKDGETALLISNANRSEIRAIDGLPGIAELPGFQNASDETVQADTSQLVLLLTPHIVRHRSNTVAGPRIAFTPPHGASAP